MIWKSSCTEMARQTRSLLSTSHSEYKHCKKKNYQTGEQIQKPSCVVDYSNSMDTVDKSDAIIRTISLVRFVTDRRRTEVVNKRTEFPFKRAAWL